MELIVIDAGHGGRDFGASGNGKREKDITLSYSKGLAKELESRGYKVIQTRETDTYLTLNRRSNIANNNNADIVISIHLNSFSNSQANGVETFYHKSSTNGRRLAESVHNQIKHYWKSDRGLKTNNLHMTRETKAPTILLELGFISNINDLNVTLGQEKQIIKSIANGVDIHFNKKPTSNNKPQELYRVRASWDDIKSQRGAYTNLDTAKTQADALNLKVFDSQGVLVYPKQHWADKHFKSLKEKGFIFHEKRFNDNLTRGEAFAMLDQITDKGRP